MYTDVFFFFFVVVVVFTHMMELKFLLVATYVKSYFGFQSGKDV